MKYVPLVSRILLGLIVFTRGLDSILHFIPLSPSDGDALTWMGIMVAHGWMNFAGVILVIGGLLLLVGRFVPFALAILAPVIVNILLYHALLWRPGMLLAIIVALLEIVLLIVYYRSFVSLFAPNPEADTREL